MALVMGNTGNWQGDAKSHYLYDIYEYKIWELVVLYNIRCGVLSVSRHCNGYYGCVQTFGSSDQLFV